MSHFAKVVDGKVVQVIVAEPEFFDHFVDSSPGAWIQTSYNTKGGVHLLNGTPLRGNYAGIGSIYDSTNDVFYDPQPYPSWTISAPNWTWTPPIDYPSDGKLYLWDEPNQSWIEI
jgi:hypothetical protein